MVLDGVLINDLARTQLPQAKPQESQAASSLEPFLNTLRVPGTGGGIDPFSSVTTLSQVTPEARVPTTGRTRGHQYGLVCQIPAYLDTDEKGRRTTKPKGELFIEKPTYVSEEEWLESGIGLPGDSGAPVIDCEDKSLYGQI